MKHTDFIATIDLGTSKMVGMVGQRNAQGALTIIAYDNELSATCIRRGCVYNVEETANKIKKLVRKLENKLSGATISKLYIGVGGQSIKTIEYAVSRVLGLDGVVTEDVIKSLYDECCNYHPDMLDVLAAVSPVYFLDDKQEMNPIGVPCNRIDVKYKLIVGRPTLKRNVIKSIEDRAKIKIEEVVVSPLALAQAVLSDDERDLGCALLGFGAGVTTLTIYKNGLLKDLTVIPFGSNLITRDITSLHIVESEAERIKLNYGSAIFDIASDQNVQVNSAEGTKMREVKVAELNNIIEARTHEILDNIYSRLDQLGMNTVLGAGVVITGGGALLKDLPEVIRKRFNMPVRFAVARKSLLETKDSISSSCEYTTAIGLLLYGKNNCATVEVKPPIIEKEAAPTVEEAHIKEKQKNIQSPTRPKERTANSFKKMMEGFSNKLFADDDSE
jgi:cell division protein FtsA